MAKQLLIDPYTMKSKKMELLRMKTVWTTLAPFVPKSTKVTLLNFAFQMTRAWVSFNVLIIRCFSKRLTVTYLSTHKQDGTGAQIQRQFSIFGLSRMIHARFIFTNYAEISVHPLDPFQTKETYDQFLSKLNRDLEISSDYDSMKSCKSVEMPNPNASAILWISIKSFFTRKNTCLRIGEPYKITEYFPEFVADVIDYLPNWKTPSVKIGATTIAIHYRQGVGGMVTYPGQKIPREIGLSYFKEILLKLKSDLTTPTRVIVLTDAPNLVTTYEPPTDQTYLWEGSPGFQDGVLTIQPLNFNDLQDVFVDLEVKSGGDPIDAIRQMAMADILIMGRSSLSYVAAILNKSGVIYFPENFWHRPLKSWIQL